MLYIIFAANKIRSLCIFCAGLAIRVNIVGESQQEQRMFDLMLVVLQGLAPAMMVVARLYGVRKRIGVDALKEGIRAVSEEYGAGVGVGGIGGLVALGDGVNGLRSELGAGEEGDEEAGMQLSTFKRIPGPTVLGGGGGDSPMHQDDSYLKRAESFKSSAKRGDRVTGLRRNKPIKNANSGLSNIQTPKPELAPHPPRNNQPAVPRLLDFTKGVSEITPPPPARASMIPPLKIPPPTVRTSMIPPSKIPLPAVQPSMIPPPTTQPPTISTGWKKNWSDDHNDFYYLNEDGESQWERPKGYVEK